MGRSCRRDRWRAATDERVSRHLVRRCVVVATLAAGCRTTAAEDLGPSAVDAVRSSVDRLVAGSYCVRGTVRATGPVVQWEGCVDGDEESYRSQIGGRVVDSRRTGDVLRFRRADDPASVWTDMPRDAPLDLSVLVRGTPSDGERRGGALRVTLHFDGEDVLSALAHIPSIGASDVVVTVVDGRLSSVHVDFADHASADLSYTPSV
jgi:hypothetical protein